MGFGSGGGGSSTINHVYKNLSANSAPERVTEVDERQINAEVQRQKRKSYVSEGRQANIISGIQSMLKQRLGE